MQLSKISDWVQNFFSQIENIFLTNLSAAHSHTHYTVYFQSSHVSFPWFLIFYFWPFKQSKFIVLKIFECFWLKKKKKNVCEPNDGDSRSYTIKHGHNAFPIAVHNASVCVNHLPLFNCFLIYFFSNYLNCCTFYAHQSNLKWYSSFGETMQNDLTFSRGRTRGKIQLTD